MLHSGIHSRRGYWHKIKPAKILLWIGVFVTFLWLWQHTMIKAAYRRKILLGLTEGESLSLAITVRSMAADSQAC